MARKPKESIAAIIEYGTEMCDYSGGGVRSGSRATAQKKCRAKMKTAKKVFSGGHYDAALAHTLAAMQVMAWADGKSHVGNLNSYD